MSNRVGKSVLAVLLLFLCGCGEYTGSIQNDLDRKIDQVVSQPVVTANHNHRYYSYYLDPQIGRIDSMLTSNIFTYNGVRFIMNLNTSRVINKEYYEPGSDEIQIDAELMAEKSGTFTNALGKEDQYTVKVYHTGQEIYAVCVYNDPVSMYAMCRNYEVADTASAMLSILCTVQVNKEKVVADFSNKRKIDYQREPLELFQFIAPESGAIQELFPDSTSSIGTVEDLSQLEDQNIDNNKHRIESDEYDYYQFAEQPE